MKKIILIFLGLLAGRLSAQTVTQAFNEPSIGDVDKNYNLDTSAYTNGLPSAVTGSASVWDFTKVTGAFPIIFDSIVTPSSALGGTVFPTASYAQKRGSINAFFKSTASPSQTELLGVYSPSLTITFTNSAIIATYPVSYGYSSIDPVTGTFKYNTTPGVCNGSITVVADGTGTLNLPGGVTFTNVLRMRSLEQLTMTASFIPVGSIHQSVFSYYVPGKKYPVITVQYQNYQLLVGTPTITANAYGNYNYFTVAGIDEQLDSRAAQTVFPNPFTDRLFVNGADSKQYAFRLYDLNGRLVAEGNTILSADLSGIGPGVYALELRDGTAVRYQKVVKD